MGWWKMVDGGGKGIEGVGGGGLWGWGLEYRIECLDEGWRKGEGECEEVEEGDLRKLWIDKVEGGLGWEDSWGGIGGREYEVGYGDYEFRFMVSGVDDKMGIE